MESKKSNNIDRYIDKLICHYNKKWTSAPFVRCSFEKMNPRDAREDFDFLLVQSLGEHHKACDTCCKLYKCKKCYNLIWAIESEESRQFAYVSVKNEAEATKASEEWKFFSIRTNRPILNGYDDFWYWKNKDFNGEIL